MSDETYDDENNENESKPNWRRDLENRAKAGDEAAKRATEAEKDANDAKRELAMIRAGINAEAGPGKFFAEKYDGPLDHDSVLAAAREAGAVPLDSVPQSAQAAEQRMQQAAAGAAPSGAGTPDFQAELDSIPMIVNGQYNPDYQRLVLNQTREQAAREGREFTVINDSAVGYADGHTAASGISPR